MCKSRTPLPLTSFRTFASIHFHPIELQEGKEFPSVEYMTNGLVSQEGL